MDYYRSPYRPRGSFSSFFWSIPQGCRGLIVACTAVYVLQYLVWLSVEEIPYRQLIAIFGLTPSLFIRGLIYQPVSYLFLHGGFMHLAFNMFLLWMFGSEMERYWGTKRFLTYYAVCGIGAALTTVTAGLIFQFGPTIGASGAILGVLLAYGLTFPERTILLYFVIPLKAKYFVLLLVVFEIVFLIPHMASGIAAFAHLGGMLFGFLYLKRAWRVQELLAGIRWRVRG
jgi:membrane associated rhomboid family serine protease